MSDPVEKIDAPNDQLTRPPVTGKADPLPMPLVLVLAFFGSGSAGYFVTLFGIGLVALAVGDPEAHLGHLGALVTNLSGLACAVLGTAIAMAVKHRPIRGFAISTALILAIALFISSTWYDRFQDSGFDRGDFVRFLSPLLVSVASCAISAAGLVASALPSLRWLVQNKAKPG